MMPVLPVRNYQQLRDMKWLSNKYAYPLVVLAILGSIVLQAAWLSQLFRAQQVQVKRDLEQAVGDAAKISNYLSLAPGHEQSENLRNFFLSPEWLQFRQAYTNMRFHDIGSRFNSDIIGDSTLVDISLRIFNGKPHHQKTHAVRWYNNGETAASVRAADEIDTKRMDSLIRLQLNQANLNVKAYNVMYNYDNNRPEGKHSLMEIQRAAYHSQQYAYNLRFLHMYQLIVPSVTGIVIYRMRYYLVSSLLMLLLTGAAFYFVFRLMRSQHLYAQARLAFTGNMTHELKTPVAIIEVALDAITRYQLTREPAKLEHYIDISKGELRRLNLMIEKVLNLDQLDNGQAKLRPELYDVQQGLERVVSSMQLRNENKGASLIYQPSDEPCFVDGDPVHLTNVFYNLIDNALKYGGENVKVKVGCTCNTNKVKISVQDNGPGIAKIYQQRIFERFFRVQDNVNIHNVKGSGLGLHYVKQIVEKHGGHVKLSSESGIGSNFTIELPAYHEV